MLAMSIYRTTNQLTLPQSTVKDVRETLMDRQRGVKPLPNKYFTSYPGLLEMETIFFFNGNYEIIFFFGNGKKYFFCYVYVLC